MRLFACKFLGDSPPGEPAEAIAELAGRQRCVFMTRPRPLQGPAALQLGALPFNHCMAHSRKLHEVCISLVCVWVCVLLPFLVSPPFFSTSSAKNKISSELPAHFKEVIIGNKYFFYTYLLQRQFSSCA